MGNVAFYHGKRRLKLSCVGVDEKRRFGSAKTKLPRAVNTRHKPALNGLAPLGAGLP